MEDVLKVKLTSLGLTEEHVSKLEAEGAKDEAGIASLSASEIKDIAGCGLVTAKQVAAAFAAVPSSTTFVSTDAFSSVLPTVPDEESWLKALRAGGVLKVEQSTVISAIRAALAKRAGLYNVPAQLVRAMEDYTDETEEQVSPEFFKLRKMLTRTNYGDLFSAIDGLDGTYVSDKRKSELLKRIDELWPNVLQFNDLLKTWQQSWLQGAANPAMLMMAFAGTAGGAMPPGMMSPPDTAVLRDAAEAVNDSINRVFRGPGVQITAALAYEASQIKETLQQPGLPALVGVPNREQMLKKLGVSVDATYPRLEQNITQFVLGIMAVPDQPAGEDELRYFGALFMLGGQIAWDKLSGHVLPWKAGLARRDVNV